MHFPCSIYLGQGFVMTIVLNTDNIINDIGAKYLSEGGASARPPKGLLAQAINESFGRLKLLYGRFLRPGLEDYASDNLSLSHTLTIELDMSSRRASGKAQSLADLSHSFLVNASLSKLYVTSKNPELGEMHDKLSVGDAQAITKLVNSKTAPYM